MKVKQSGHIGDLIYSLSAVQAVSKLSGEPVDFYIGFDVMNTVNGHPSGKFTMNTESYNYIKPLLEAIPFIKSVNKHAGEEIDYDFDKFRSFRLPVEKYDLRKWHTIIYPELQIDIADRIFQIEDKLPYVEGKIVVNFTNRYRHKIDFSILQEHSDKLFFVGLDAEHQLFESILKREVKRIHVKNGLHMAQILNSCKVFIGNQSSTFAMAEQMKVPRVLEVFLGSPNVITTGNSLEYCTTEGLNHIFKILLTL